MTNTEDPRERRHYNAATDLVDINVSRGLGAKVAFVDPVRELTYGELQTATYRFADAMRTLGLRQESRIVLLLLDTVEFPIVFWGAIRAGIVPIPLSNQLATAQYAYILDDCRAEVILISGPLLQIIEPVLADLDVSEERHRRRRGRPRSAPLRPAMLSRMFWRRAARPVRFPDRFGRGRVLALFIGFDRRSQGREACADLPDRHRAAYSARRPSASARRRLFSAGKLFFAYGLANSMAFPMSVGATTILVPEPATPQKVIETMRKYRPTVFFGGPALYAAMLAHNDIGPGAGSDRLLLCVSGGDTLPASVSEQWRAAVGVNIVEGAGATEILTFLSNRPDDLRYGTPGKPLPGYDAKILDADGEEARRRRGRRTRRARTDQRRRLLEPAGEKSPHFRRRMGSHRRHVSSRQRWLLPFLRAQR